jgi:hypothetical protein
MRMRPCGRSGLIFFVRATSSAESAMDKLSHDQLQTLESYARQRKDFRARVMAHKKRRSVHLGEHMTLLFEDRLTVQYQVQEMLRVERIFEPEGIAEELEAYNPLIPDGRNLKATLLIEYPDIDERQRALSALRGVEHMIELVVAGHAAVTAVADEDLERSNDNKTSAVHFLRFELTPAMIAAWQRGAAVTLAVSHAGYDARIEIDASTRDALAADFA